MTHPGQPVDSPLAPVDIWAEGFRDLRGIAVDAAGNVYVADREAGTVTRIGPDHSRWVVADRLDGPVGLAFEPTGVLLVAEERSGRVSRLEPGGRRTRLVAGLKHPRWLAADADGRIFTAARRAARGPDHEADDDSAAPDTILVRQPTAALAVFADGFRRLEGLAVAGDVLLAATRGRAGEPMTEGLIIQIPIRRDGTAGPPGRLGAQERIEKPVGLAVDRLGALFVTAQELRLPDGRSKRAIAKLTPDGGLTRFASLLRQPHGLAFDLDGNLYVADGEAGRVLRFRAPSAPTLDAPPEFTNQEQMRLAGVTGPRARIAAFADDGSSPLVAIADASGRFTVPIALAPNATSALELFATGAAGAGLTGAPAMTAITHDSIEPSLGFQTPAAGAFVRGGVGVEARASDGGSGVAWLTLHVATQPLGAALAPPPPAPALTATAPWDTRSTGDGVQTLTATARDRAGNIASRARVVIVDNTPPEARISDGPEGTISASSATLGFSGTDNLTGPADLLFAWRLDGGGFTAFATSTSATVADLGAGLHTFEVKARDRAGNESAMPALRRFTVSPGSSVAITSPADGEAVPAGAVLVRGAVQTEEPEVGVTVNGFPAAVQGNGFAVLVPVTADTVALTAAATTAGGATAHHAVGIIVGEAVDDRPVLVATPGAGSAPLTVVFSLAGAEAITMIELDPDDGSAALTLPALEGQAWTYAQPGLYVPRVAVTDDRGNRRTARAIVQALDHGGLDALLHAKWSGFRDSLRRGEIDAALEFIAVAARDEYRADFTALAPFLPAFGRDLEDLRSPVMSGGHVDYELLSSEDSEVFSYQVQFVQDEDGRWRIRFF